SSAILSPSMHAFSFLYSPGPPPALPSFPTRRSSDLTLAGDDVTWHVDPASERYAAELGSLLALLHAVPVAEARDVGVEVRSPEQDRKSTRLNSSHVKISYAVFCLKKKNRRILMRADD